MIRFFLVTGKQYAALDSPDPEAIYFIRDEHRIQTAGVDFASGISGFGHVIGGYPAAVASYSNTEDAVSVTLKAVDAGEDVDMTKYLPGGDIWFNICSDAGDPQSLGHGKFRQRCRWRPFRRKGG